MELIVKGKVLDIPDTQVKMLVEKLFEREGTCITAEKPKPSSPLMDVEELKVRLLEPDADISKIFFDAAQLAQAAWGGP